MGNEVVSLNPLTATGIEKMIFVIRDKQVLLDRDLATLYGVETKRINEQVKRFRENGFAVWMDDFGSGYSSLHVLQSIQFDLIKFDMRFTRNLDEGENGKIILTELMKLAGQLKLDTVCEGVETEEQVRFLQKIGCSKLQGYYFSQPLPYEPEKETNETDQ